MYSKHAYGILFIELGISSPLYAHSIQRHKQTEYISHSKINILTLTIQFFTFGTSGRVCYLCI